MIFIIDIDGTICGDSKGDYQKAVPMEDRIQKVNRLYDEGNYIILWTARGMSRNNGIASKAYEQFFELTKNQLEKWGVKHHELRLGKPHYDIWIDDKAIFADEWFKK